MKISVSLFGHPTSLTLEQEFYDGLKEIAADKQMKVYRLLELIDGERGEHPLSSYVRVYVLRYFKEKK